LEIQPHRQLHPHLRRQSHHRQTDFSITPTLHHRPRHRANSSPSQRRPRTGGNPSVRGNHSIQAALSSPITQMLMWRSAAHSLYFGPTRLRRENKLTKLGRWKISTANISMANGSTLAVAGRKHFRFIHHRRRRSGKFTTGLATALESTTAASKVSHLHLTAPPMRGREFSI